MRYSCLKNPIRVYLKFLMLVFIVLGYLDCGNGLVGNYKAVILY